MIKKQQGYNKILAKNKKILNNIDNLNKTAPNFFPFGKGEKINILPVFEGEIFDYNQTRKDKFVNDCSKMLPCYENMNRTPERLVIKNNERDFKRDIVNQNAEKRYTQQLLDNNN